MMDTRLVVLLSVITVCVIALRYQPVTSAVNALLTPDMQLVQAKK